MNTLTFDSAVKLDILRIFGKDVDKDGFIITKDAPHMRVATPAGEQIHIDEFAGIYKGSEIFAKSDIISLIELSDKLD